ncbi:MAG: Transcriptional activator protein NhaR [Candidatus Omnitrophica bacterium ADurb.Bin292]|jgi:LysR family transcriptional activator of nhaA|nr:MAG: Transcriptional activator protein NhaR [Candidatus Omnitrophica bacterium ADurb.Bin292]HOG24166.1 LysR family transcriptional regulator [Candidatus Omnitrophota bacterium]HQB12617.1 LysR family transcriptional regulator [Candidatus Omnitrophota bacterium]
MIPFNFHHLYYFYIVAKERSFSRAARILCISQPALSAQIRQFESYWNFRLLDREGRQVTLTEEGALLFNSAKAIFDLSQELADGMSKRKYRIASKIQLGVSSAVPKEIVERLVRFILQADPDAHLTLRRDRIETMVEDLMVHKLDLILNDFAYPSPFEENIQNHLIATVPMVFCASKKLARKLRDLPEGLDGAPLIVPTAPDQTYQAVQNYIHEHGVKPKVVAEIQDLEMARTLVAMGKGIGLFNSYSVEQSPGRKDLVVLRDHSRHKITDAIYLIRRERKIPHPLVSKILEQFPDAVRREALAS